MNLIRKLRRLAQSLLASPSWPAPAAPVTDDEVVGQIRAVPAHFADNTYPCWAPATINAEFNHKASEANSISDLAWYDAANHCLRAASTFTDQGSAAATQQAFAAVFAGVFSSKQLSTDATARGARVTIDSIWELPCVSSTFAVGDYVAPNYSASALQNQTLVRVTDPSLAIGRVVKEYTVATTVVKVRLTASKLNGTYGQQGREMSFANLTSNFRNVIDGGDFTVNPWQRGTAQAADIAGTLTYTADRFFTKGAAGSAINWSRQADTGVAGFSQALRWQRKAANADVAVINLGQVVETADSIRLQGRQVTLSFWVKCGANFLASSATCGLKIITGTSADDTANNMLAAAWAGQANALNTTFAPTTTDQLLTFTATIPATATQIGVLFFYTPSGAAGANEWLQFKGIQLEDGPVATPFEHRDIQVELEICQRYFYQLNEPAAGISMGQGQCSTTTVANVLMPLPVQMRTAPTVTVTKGTIGVTVAAGTNQALTTLAAGTGHTVNQIQLTATASAANLVAGSATLLNGNGGTGLVAASADY